MNYNFALFRTIIKILKISYSPFICPLFQKKEFLLFFVLMKFLFLSSLCIPFSFVILKMNFIISNFFPTSKIFPKETKLQ